MEERWLLIDVAHQGEVRLACATPSNPAIANIYKFETGNFLTFTDALMCFERESGQRLSGMNTVIAIAGAAVGDSIPIIRTRWNISRGGLASMMGRPVTILNEVAAQAWATLSSMPIATPVRGTGAPNLQVRSRHLFIAMDDGIGTAMIDVDEDGRATVIEAEGGHCDFAPQNERELAMCRALSPLGDPVTFEQVLLLPKDSPAWRALGDPGDREREEWRAEILGRLAANLMFSTGAWAGVMMRGGTLPVFHPGARKAFDTGFSSRRSFRRLIGAARCSRVELTEPVLAGAAALMMQRHRMAEG